MTTSENFTYLCRTCATLTIETTRKQIFEDGDLFQNLSSVMQYVQITFSKQDNLPKVMCESCVSKLKVVYEFIVLSKAVDVKLNKILQEQTVSIKTEVDSDDNVSDNFVKTQSHLVEWVILPKEEKVDYNPEEIDPAPLLMQQNIFCAKQQDESSPIQLSSQMFNVGVCASPALIPLGPSSSSLKPATLTVPGPTSESLPQLKSVVCNISVNNSPISSNILVSHADQHQALYSMANVNVQQAHSSKNTTAQVWDKHFSTPYLDPNRLLLAETEFEKSAIYREERCREKNKCFTCYIAFPTHYELMKHKENHQNNLICRFCNLDFPTNKMLIKHYDSKEHAKSVESVSKLWKCGVCEKSYSKIREHVETHGGYSFSCKKCSLQFATRRRLFQHDRNTHKKKNCTCEACGKDFYYKFQVENHYLKAHTTEKPFKCDKCNSCFVTKGGLNSHLQSISHIDPSAPVSLYKCDICNKTYSGKKRYQAHCQTHKRRKHICEVCGAKYVRKMLLMDHMKIHTGENRKEHVCHLCGKAVVTSKSLEYHLLLHAGVKNFICDVCGKAFTLKSTLAVHARTHTNEKRYECKVCSKRFTQRSTVVSHMKKQHNIDDRVRKLKDT